MCITIIAIITTLGLLYFYFKFKYFTRRDPIPGLDPEFFFGNMRQTEMLSKKRSIAEVHLALKDRFGDVYRLWMGPSQLITVCNADDVQHIFQNRQIYEQGDVHLEKFSLLFQDALICSIGPKYKRHASLTLPLFRRSKVHTYFNIIADCTDKFLLDSWRSAPINQIHQNIVKESQSLFLAIIGYVAFDFDLEAPNGSALVEALEHFVEIFVKTLFMPTWISRIYLKFNSQYHQSLRIIHQYLDRIIEKEQQEDQKWTDERKRHSLIASLVHSLQKDEDAEALKSEEDKKGLSKNEILHEMLLFLVAGYETTSTALSWFIHLISKHPRVQTKLKAELIDVPFTAENIDSLVYLNAVLNEVLRFAPPSNGTVRTLTMNDRLPNSGQQLFKGEQISIPFYNLARDKRYWKFDPELFYPERFLEDDLDKNHHPYALIPFGGGHRQCIGQNLARFELKVIIARLMQHVTFMDGGSQMNSGGHEQQFTIIPRHVGVRISLD